MTDSDAGYETVSPQKVATLPGEDEDYVVTLNGKVLRQSKFRPPGEIGDVETMGRLYCDGQLGDDPAVVEVYFDGDGIIDVHVNHMTQNYSSEITYELREAKEQPADAERWETRRSDLEATVEIVPFDEVIPDVTD